MKDYQLGKTKISNPNVNEDVKAICEVIMSDDNSKKNIVEIAETINQYRDRLKIKKLEIGKFND